MGEIQIWLQNVKKMFLEISGYGNIHYQSPFPECNPDF
jgi:hypothetical protein